MANFKTHISWGVVVGIALATICAIYSLTTSFDIIFWVFLTTVIGSFLPDLDVDDGIPFKIVFGLLSAGLAMLVCFYFFDQGNKDFKYLFLLPVSIFLVTRFLVGYVFMQLTHHRGMFHSIPTAVVFGLMMMWILRKNGLQDGDNLILSIAVFVGCIVHLLLDELYSSIAFNGLKFRSKKSLGTALKMSSSSHVSTFLVYFILIVLTFALYELGMFSGWEQFGFFS